ncbi:MAG TPA: DNA polymerase III subunit alpha [Lactovum miscens]|uniref:DNA polymerase III subunit alpha n=1 Tax=Lactovum miscens TaxID=190387 RepID=UPI002ED8C619
MTFAQLNTKTEYSFFESVLKLEEYLDRALELGYKTLGICDQDNLFAAFRFVKLAQSKGIQPVVSFRSNLIIEEQTVETIFVALNTEGYHNLLRISTRLNYNSYDIFDLLDGVAIILNSFDFDSSKKFTCPIYFYSEILTELRSDQVNQFIAFPSVKYLASEDAEVLQVLQSIKAGERIDGTAKTDFLHRPEVYEKFYQEKFPIALDNLNQLVENIHYDLAEKLELPRFDQSRLAVENLQEEAISGLKKRVNLTSEYEERLKDELSIIHQMGFDDYFLIVADLLRYAAKNNIYCGMGRGSSAGSLVAYSLGITHLDPIENNFLFERFLNPERIAMPDIDIDIPDEKRQELLTYMQRRYGTEHVAQVLTFSTFGKRQALRDVGKAFGMNEMELSQMTSSIYNPRGNLTEEFKNNQRFKAEILRSELLQQVFNFAQKIEGLPRQTSLHASAIVLSEEPLYRYVALKPSDGLAVAQYEAVDIESIGLLKIDFLGLNYLSLIDKVRERVKQQHSVDIDPLSINLQDDETLALFRAGNTEGIFQFWRSSARRLLKQLEPTKFEDVANARAIRNPGASDFIPQFIARRQSKEKVQAVDPVLTEILAPTFGIMIYQEQVMQVTQKYAGFSLGQADILRRNISKRKSAEEFEKMRELFVSGATSLGHKAEKASEIYDLIVKFAGFGFNRSHAYVYAALAFQLAYFKAHFPDEFYEVYLENYDRKRVLVDLKENHYQFAKIDINKSPYHDKVSQGVVYLGLTHVKGLPRDLAYWLIENRPFEDLSELIRHLPSQWQQATLIRPLIEVGAFDSKDPNRGKLLANLTNLINYSSIFQLDLFATDQLSFSYREAEDLSLVDKYEIERERLDVALSSHPITEWLERLEGLVTPLNQLNNNKVATILVEITSVRTSNDRNGKQMAFVETTDTVSNITTVFFADNYLTNRRFIERGKIVLIKGRAELRNDEMQVKASIVIPVEETNRKLWISNADNNKNSIIADILRNNPGPCQVVFHNEETKTTLQTRFYVEDSERLLNKLSSLDIKVIYR